MNIYLLAAIGGALIGVSAVLLMALSGRIAGISGIVGGLLPPKPAPDRTWRLAFILGLVLAPLVLRALSGTEFIGAPTNRSQKVTIEQDCVDILAEARRLQADVAVLVAN